MAQLELGPLCKIRPLLSAKNNYWITLCRCSTGADLATDPRVEGSVAKVVQSWEKTRENAELVMKSLTGQYSYRQDVMSIPSGTFFTWSVVEAA